MPTRRFWSTVGQPARRSDTLGRAPETLIRPDPDEIQGRGYAYGGPALIGGVLVGFGLGILLDDFFAWLVIGVGAGFILMGFIAALGK